MKNILSAHTEYLRKMKFYQNMINLCLLIIGILSAILLVYAAVVI